MEIVPKMTCKIYTSPNTNAIACRRHKAARETLKDGRCCNHLCCCWMTTILKNLKLKKQLKTCFSECRSVSRNWHSLYHNGMAQWLQCGTTNITLRTCQKSVAWTVSSTSSSASHGCRKHCSAVALFAGSKSSIGIRKSAISKALRSSQRYFSTNTSIRPHGLSFDMWRNSPAEQNNDRMTCNNNKKKQPNKLNSQSLQQHRHIPVYHVADRQ